MRCYASDRGTEDLEAMRRTWSGIKSIMTREGAPRVSEASGTKSYSAVVTPASSSCI